MMSVYAVCLLAQGKQQGGALYVVASSAEEAMSDVETRLGLKPPCANINKETGKMTVTNWHGYEFRARRMQE
jgi:hypothetical protein